MLYRFAFRFAGSRVFRRDGNSIRRIDKVFASESGLSEKGGRDGNLC